MIVIHLARKPLSEPSVAANVLKHGTGGLNVDGCRISTSGDNLGDPTRFDGADDHTRTEWHRPHMTLGTMSRKHAHAFEKMASGRWPANLILEHRKRCRVVGEKKVQAAGWGNADRSPSFGTVYGHDRRIFHDRTSRHYADPDGTETVEAWDCVDGCPVADLDEQSGILKSGARNGRHISNRSGDRREMYSAWNVNNTGNTFSASARVGLP